MRWVVGFGVAASLVALLWYGLGRDPRVLPSPLVGRPAADFTLRLFSGGTVSLRELRGRPVIVNFWASWCTPCVAEAPVLEGAWRAYRDRGLVVIGVNVQDTEADARAFLRRFGHSFPNGPDRGGRIQIEYGVYGLPETFFIRPDGTILAKQIGPVTERVMRERVAELLEGTASR